MEYPTITITVNAVALATICKEASEMTWTDIKTRQAVISLCHAVKRKCKEKGIEVEMGDGK